MKKEPKIKPDAPDVKWDHKTFVGEWIEEKVNTVEMKGGWGNIFANKNICVFGGTGTIGSLIIEYIRRQQPRVIRVFSNDENSLWESQEKWGIGNMRYLLGDIRDYKRVKSALNKIDYVFNCAAIKHVPFAEYNPTEAVGINILGFDNIIGASVERHVKKILHISTDKAVEPTTIMGCTKMISERLAQMRWAQNPEVDMVIVRLGNVYGSRGSVIELVRRQKKQGKNITITNRDMERYFMQPHEVVDFIIKAFNNGHQGEIWVPKLHSKRIIDVIQKEVGPDCTIEVIGNRIGEKMSEKLLFDHEISLADGTNRDYWIIQNEYR